MPTARTKSPDSPDTEAISPSSEAAQPKATQPPPQVVVARDEMMPEGMDRSALSSEMDPEVVEEEWCLFLYDPLAVGRGMYSETYIIVPVSVQVATQKGALHTYEYKTLSKGLQRIRKKDAELILQCQARPFIEMMRRNVLRFWSEKWKLSDMTENEAIDAIRKCEQRTLIDLWMENKDRYTVPVREDLLKRKAELETPQGIQQI